MINENGFTKKTFYEIKDSFEARAKAYYGSDINFSSHSDLGFLSGEIAYMVAGSWEGLEALYLSQDINSATGVYLDRLVALRGVKRLTATNTIVPILITGVEGTLISPRNLIAAPGDDQLFTNRKSTVISITSCYTTLFFLRSWVMGEVISFTINGILIAYTANAADSALNVFNRIEELLILNALPVTLKKDSEKAVLTLISKTQKNTLTFQDLSKTWQIMSVGTLLDFTADKTGLIFAAADTVTELKNPIYGVASINNPFGSLMGREIETDKELRERLFTATIAGLATDSAIENQVKQVEGVSTAKCISNRTKEEDSEGRPEHSFEVIVVGGEDEPVAKTIKLSQPAGIGTFGNTTVDLPAQEGMSSEITRISFSRAESVLIATQVTVEPYTEEGNLPANLEFLIKKALIEFSAEEYVLGKDVIRQRLLTPIYGAVSGIGTLVVKVAIAENVDTFPTDLIEENIPIASREMAVLNEKLIRVRLV